jgi:3-hydroxyacyl-[acyl-carrier-protein] dehydratase
MNAAKEYGNVMDLKQIAELLPHRYPFLLIDRVIECVPGESLVGIKNVTINEPFFNGHFPLEPIMPGVLIIESLAQACGVLAFRTHAMSNPEIPNGIFVLVGVDECRFKRPVVPGDQLRLEARLKRQMRGIWMFEARATVDGYTIAECELRCAMREADK